MRPPDIDSLPPVARSGMEPAPGRGPFVAYKPFWNVGSIAAAIVVFAVWATLAADELSNGKGSVRAIGVLAVAHLFGWLWIATRFYLEESPSGVRRLEHAAVRKGSVRRHPPGRDRPRGDPRAGRCRLERRQRTLAHPQRRALECRPGL